MPALSGQEHDQREWMDRHNIPGTVEWARLHDDYNPKPIKTLDDVRKEREKDDG